jgi:predicted transcriptional regulator
MSGTTTIKVDSAVRDRLAMLAAQRGSTSHDLVAELAQATPTREELHARHTAATAYIREHLCPELSEEGLAAGKRFWRELAAGRVPASLSVPADHSQLAG